MTTYAIGDIQGCAKSFDKLLEAISFDHDRDHLWLAGDLVNRGPDSLGVLRRVVEMEERVTTVLGNHDLHLLATAAGVHQQAQQRSRTIAEALEHFCFVLHAFTRIFTKN